MWHKRGTWSCSFRSTKDQKLISMGLAFAHWLSPFIFLATLFILPFALHAVSGTGTSRSIYIVHMDKSLMPKAFPSHHHWYSATIDSIKVAGTAAPAAGAEADKPNLLYTYDNALHGFSAVLSPEELENLKKSPGFISAYRDAGKILPDTTHTPEFLSLNPATGLWPASDYGKDVIVGVVDSGVWPESRSFHDAGMTPIPARWKGKCEDGKEFNSSMCNLKLIGARSFNKGLLAETPSLNISMNSARDTDGHGTHTASTVAGNYVEDVSYFGYAKGTARGVSPRAKLAAYKVLWKEGNSDSDFLAGIDQAVADGVDVVSLSLGYRLPVPLYEDSIAIASFGAMTKGVLVVSSAGNRGSSGLGTTSKGIPWALIVAAGSVDREFAGTITLGNGLTVVGWTMFPANVPVQEAPLVYNATLSGCNSTVLLDEADPDAVIICDHDQFVSSQVNIIAGSRVRAAIFIYDISDDPSFYELDRFPAPGVVITPRDAAAVIQYAKNGSNPTVSIKFKQTRLGTKPAPVAAAYSSRGPAPAFPGILKPDIMAPGTRILAAWIPNQIAATIGPHAYLESEYNMLSGTSMACPHAAGVAALLKGAHPEWSPAAIRSAMMTTANPLDNTFNPIQDNDFNSSLVSPLVIGAGHVDPNRALDPGLIYDATAQDYLNLLCSSNFTREQIITITRSNISNCSNLSYDLNYPSFMALYKLGSTATLVKRFQRTVTNVGVGAATYTAQVVAPSNATVTVSPKTLVFSKKNEKLSYTLTVRYESGMNSYGTIVWVENGGGNHRVRSPIMVSSPFDSSNS
ncbi:subtilisin-like protease SBT3 [Malania oleifera]|uniref:subtilisin-like protease SBT3 n=1 Tax=Malania oleifera TaxID=397392 RepID=UPI0025ADCE1B|nr:subtilisin-like protease SBT3 [Malania oleifera]